VADPCRTPVARPRPALLVPGQVPGDSGAKAPGMWMMFEVTLHDNQDAQPLIRH